MKKSSILLLFAVFSIISASVSAQTINQKLITTLPQVNGYTDAYSLKYDPNSGGWVYGAYDTTSRTYTIISPKGTSIAFNFVMQYNSVFDAEGNSYTIASNNITDTTFSYSVVKNHEVLATYDNILEGWAMKDGMLYFAATEAGKSNLFVYDTKAGTFSKGKSYDEVRLAYTPMGYSEGEPVGYVGFTKAGSPYYVAKEGNEVFLVIGTDEQKHYADISWYDMKFDAAGNPCYIAKSSGTFYSDRGNTFLVQGTNESRSFDWIYGPVEFNPSGEPVYVGQDSTGEYKYRATLMVGANPVKTVEGSIFNYMYSTGGKLAYVISTDTQNKNGEYVYQNNLVYDGKQSKTYSSINNIKFTSSGKPVFIAADKKNKYFVIMDGQSVSDKYDYISDYTFLSNGDMAYIGTKYGDYEKKISDKSYVYIGDEKFGPYNMINTYDWKTGSQIANDNKGNYAYIAGENIDYDNYIYKYQAFTNKWSSKKFDNLADLRIINGKFAFFGGDLVRKDIYLYNYRLYIDNKPLGDVYSSYTDLNVDASGVMTFLASKGDDMYWVEVKP